MIYGGVGYALETTHEIDHDEKARCTYTPDLDFQIDAERIAKQCKNEKEFNIRLAMYFWLTNKAV